MSDEFDKMDELDEEMEVITMIDDETEEEIEFVVIDRKELNGTEYLLVIESAYIDDDEAEAAILKVVNETEQDITYSVIDDDDEFDAAAALFETAGQATYVYAMSGMAVVAAPMIASYSIVSLILSRIFLKEKLSAKQYVAVAIVMLGIAALGLAEGLAE